MPRVVILGGGFGGLYAAQALRRESVQITLVDRRNFHLFQPLLYQVATGSLSPGEIAAPLRSVLSRQKNAQVLLGEATGLDAARRTLQLDGEELPYDFLVVATGMQHHYFGHDEWSAHAPGLKSVEDATRIRTKILRAFEMAERERDPGRRQAWLTFVIVGGGPTGVELAGALGEIANYTLRHDFRAIRPEEARILLLDGSDRVLSSYPPKLSDAAVQQLIRLGVRTRTGVRVTSVDDHGVNLGAERIEAETVLWAAGVKGSPFGQVLQAEAGAQLDRQGRVIVEPDLTVPGHPEIFVIGDLANYSHQGGQPLPGVAPVAMQQAVYVARHIVGRAPARFEYFDKGSLAVIGRAAAVAHIGPFQLRGRVAWLTWLFIHLLYIVEFESRLVIALKWGLQYFTFSRGARLITGPAED
jgi:NADH dehydrogenase